MLKRPRKKLIELLFLDVSDEQDHKTIIMNGKHFSDFSKLVKMVFFCWKNYVNVNNLPVEFK